ncbi:hypothetical protein EW146_g3010 [Bondarzewia mesenterica]|uniref:cysteine--tRNA ligase n=1 Tax=Bondarzewia mesenterica TaxID=1095465 RepID=A0A4S4M4S1_9AGAM|nr:hypothetical protein EW146_g3010 [Bondarzewia mesenterica]
MSTQQPPWAPPAPQEAAPVLKVYNSLTKTKTEFIPREGKRVKWYNCGPTVYDASHMGHARNYVTQDILRRIVTDYFGYDVHFVMNITDIDDKIILRARQNYLVQKLRTETQSLSSELLAQALTAWKFYVRSKVSKGLLPSDTPSIGAEWDNWPALAVKYQDKSWKADCLKRDEKFDMHFSATARAFSALEVARGLFESNHTSPDAAHQLIDDATDVLAPSLDQEFGATVTDPSISRSLAAFWEQRFFDDMARLHVREPDTLTRVTEYVPEIVAFVERIILNGYGYEVDGSVYFDTRAFDQNKDHFYAKLEPWSKGNRELLEEGEGALSSTTGRRSPADFALWKASKPGEPSWQSPWGQGRPGWHIECSVMASAIFGDNMDIHSGGIDLAFPHHDNEMAQSEAYHECGAWVNYFLHTGHLHIEGLKMSKSLKNFITIDNFFTTAKALIAQTRAEGPSLDGKHRFESFEIDLTNALHQSQDAFRVALCDSFNTPIALNVLRELVSRTNVYINSRGKELNVGVVERVARWVGNMLRMFGLGEGETSEVGWGQEQEDGQVAANRDEVLMPYLRALSSFRDGVRQLAIAKGDGAAKEILALCDKLRDVDMVPLGVALDDQEDGKALVKLVSPAELKRTRDEKRAQAEAKAAKKAAAVEAERQKRIQKLEKGRVPPTDMFKPPNVPEGTYGSWDDAGLPLTDAEGNDLSKNQGKKVQKEWTAQKKLHEDFQAWKREQE